MYETGHRWLNAHRLLNVTAFALGVIAMIIILTTKNFKVGGSVGVSRQAGALSAPTLPALHTPTNSHTRPNSSPYLFVTHSTFSSPLPVTHSTPALNVAYAALDSTAHRCLCWPPLQVALEREERHIIYGLSMIVFAFCQIIFRLIYPNVRP